MARFRKGLVGGKGRKTLDSKTTLVKLFQSMIHVNKLCLVAKTSLTYIRTRIITNFILPFLIGKIFQAMLTQI